VALDPERLEIGLGCANLLELSLPEFIETAARHGFRRISVRPWAFARALEQGFTEASLRERLAAAGIEVSIIDCLHRGLPGVPPPDTIEPALRALFPPDLFDPPDEETVFRAAEALGTSIVNLNHYRGGPVPLDEMARAVGAICRRAAARGLEIALEFVPGTGLPDLPFARAVAEACGEPNCALILDLYHLDRSGGAVEDVRRLSPNAIANIQLSDRIRPPLDTPAKPMAGRELPGRGELPLRELLAAALENSPGASVDIEVLNEELRDLPTDEACARLAAAAKAWRTAR
jgi:sugar phosphate isomerase/epimerase